MHLTRLLPLLPLTLASPLQFPFSSPLDSTASSDQPETLVPLSLGVMSRCPDAEICETLIDRVLDTRTGGRGGREVVGDLVKLELIYLAKENSTSDARTFGNMTCLHGRLECQANVQQLCAARHWSRSPPLLDSADTDDFDSLVAEKGNGDWKTWWNFVQCMNYGKRDRVGELSTAKACAKVVGKDWTSELEECSKDSPDSEGAKLFRKSVAKTKKLDIEKSCTFVLNSRKICVHDGTWKECSNGHEVGDFVSQIKAESKRLNTPSKQDEFAREDEEDDWIFA